MGGEVILPGAGGNPTDEQMHQALQIVAEEVRRAGWVVLRVNSPRSGGWYSHTVGMTPAGLPELVVAGLGAAKSAALLHALCPLHLACGEQGLAPGVAYLTGRWFATVGVPADADAYPPAFAWALYCRANVRLLEVSVSG